MNESKATEARQNSQKLEEDTSGGTKTQKAEPILLRLAQRVRERVPMDIIDNKRPLCITAGSLWLTVKSGGRFC